MIISSGTLVGCMRICIACQSPGGPEGIVTAPLEESEILDHYEARDDGSFEHIAQTRQCAGCCSDAVEGIARREVKAVIVAGVSPNSLLKFTNDRIRVLKASSRSVKGLMQSFANGALEEIGMDKFAKLRR
jgi:predicted Fe-Mo cluster-binding NifX family protein